MEGWIKLHRKLLENPVWDNPELLKMWIWCLMKATHKETDVMIGTTVYHLLPGQFITGRKSAAEELSSKPSTVYDHMKILEKLGMVSLNSGSKSTVVTIEKWGLYQLSTDLADINSATVRQQSDINPTSIRHKQEHKNDKNEKNHSYMGDGQDDFFAKGYVPSNQDVADRLAAMRQRIREVRYDN